MVMPGEDATIELVIRAKMVRFSFLRPKINLHLLITFLLIYDIIILSISVTVKLLHMSYYQYSELRIEIKKNGLVPRVPRVPRVSRVRVTQTLSVSDEHTLNILCKLAGNVVAVVDYFMR